MSHFSIFSTYSVPSTSTQWRQTILTVAACTRFGPLAGFALYPDRGRGDLCMIGIGIVDQLPYYAWCSQRVRIDSSSCVLGCFGEYRGYYCWARAGGACFIWSSGLMLRARRLLGVATLAALVVRGVLESGVKTNKAD